MDVVVRWDDLIYRRGGQLICQKQGQQEAVGILGSCFKFSVCGSLHRKLCCKSQKWRDFQLYLGPGRSACYDRRNDPDDRIYEKENPSVY